MTSLPPTSPEDPNDPNGPNDPEGSAPSAKPKRALWRRLGRAAWRALLFVVVVVALLVCALTWTVHTDRGTRFAWDTATTLLKPRLSGTLDGGSLQSGVRLHQVEWRDAGTDIRIDRLAGRWRLSHSPWRFTIEYLRLGTVDVHPGPPKASAPSSTLSLPHALISPLQFDLRDIRIDRIALHSARTVSAAGAVGVAGKFAVSAASAASAVSMASAASAASTASAAPIASVASVASVASATAAAMATSSISDPVTMQIDDIALHGSSDGRHHRVVLDRVTTPYGQAHARLMLDGLAPFVVSGAASFAGNVGDRPVTVSATVSGTLAEPVADIHASGMKLAASAHLVASPFAAVPFKQVSISADHLNPQAFSPNAPAADLTVRAQLQPEIHPEALPQPERTAATKHSTVSKGSAATTPTGASKHTAPLIVSGPVSIVNANPGALDAHLLPLIDAHAVVHLDATRQRLDALTVHLVKEASLTGQGAIVHGKGQLTVDIAKLDLHALQSALRPTSLSGKVNIGLDGSTQNVKVQLDDASGTLGLRASVTATPSQTVFNDLQLTAGKGSARGTGSLKRDNAASFAFKGELRNFDPLALMSNATAAHATGQRIDASVSGTFDATGNLSPEIRAKVGFALTDSVYDGLPMTGQGTLQLAGTRLLPSRVALSVAGNQVDLNGSFGTPRDRLVFDIDAPQLDRLGFGLAGQLRAKGDVTGSIAHPNVTAQYEADQVVFGTTKIGHAAGQAQLHDGANGALNASIDASDVTAPGLTLQTLVAQVAGTRAHHTVQANARGSLRGNTLDAIIAAEGSLTDRPGGMGWKGTISQLQNRGVPDLQLMAPVTVDAAPKQIELGATHLALEGATLDLQSASYRQGQIRSTGTVTRIDVNRMLALKAEMTGKPDTTITDLVIDGDWDVAIGETASGHVELRRRSGDLQVNAGQGNAGLGLEKLIARVDFINGNRAHFTLNTQAARIGSVSADLSTTLTLQDGMLSLGEDSPLSGKITGDVPSLRTTGGLLGPAYLLDGALALRLSVDGTLGKPQLTGSLTGQKLAAALLDQGVELRDGVIDIVIADNQVDFRHVEFHGSKGTLIATGKVRLDVDDPNVTAKVTADKLELFGAPDRQLSVSGAATLANGGPGGGLAIDGKFTVDHALFDLPQSSAPKLGDDVVIVRSDGQATPATPHHVVAAAEKPVGPFAPRANVTIDLGKDFHFRGAGAVLGLVGALTVKSEPNAPLSAEGNVSVTPGSTYEAFGRKLAIETGFFTFNGPIDNPSINLLAMRRNQEVEAGVRVRGTLRAPDAQLVSEPSVTDDEKLSWLLFGHGLDSGQNLGQQNTMAAALALVGSAGGKRIAQTVGLDEFTIGTSDSGLTDAQVVSVAKALNEHFVLGYEQGLQSAGYLFKLTWLLSRRWSVGVQAGTFNGMSLLFTNRFD